MRFLLPALLALIAGLPIPPSVAAGEHAPDPHAVQRCGPAYRYPQAGWVVLHIEGEPYERGYQHGRLMAPEIAAYVRCFAAMQTPKAPAEGWKHTRTLVNALFLRRFGREWLEEMKGIADGAADAGARFNDRAVDIVDIAALNLLSEIDSLDAALDATPTGLEGLDFPRKRFRPATAPPRERCSAFAATGPATADGKVVVGHVTMSDLYTALFSNVWIDLKPAKGRRVVMQSFPGGIQSGMDYYLNDAGLVVCETTIGQTRFDPSGVPLAARVRKAAQYADTIDKVVSMLKEGGNGLYTNEWLIADVNTNEIALFELGTKASRLRRSSKQEWFGGTEGFYWGCNNAKDLGVRLETVPALDGKPANLVWSPTDRDKAWVRFYAKHKGKITADSGKLAFATPPLSGTLSLDAKVTTTELAKRLQTQALFGPPSGRLREPTADEREKFPEIRPLVTNPWTVLHAGPPPEAAVRDHPPDFPKRVGPFLSFAERFPAEAETPAEPAWHGTILPKTDADIWLAAGFAEYEKIVALENALRAEREDGKLTPEDRDRIGVELFAHQCDYRLGRKRGNDLEQDARVRAETGKGVLLLHALREAMGPKAFDAAMGAFGRANAGKRVDAAAFRAHMAKAGKCDLEDFFKRLADREGTRKASNGSFTVLSFYHELDRSLIVYGTTDDETANRAAAEALQEAIRTRFTNMVVPIKADRDLKDDELKGRHLLLVGRPSTNRLAERFRSAFPVEFGRGSFRVRGEVYAHPGSAIVVAGENPLDRNYSAVLLAGLSGDATYHAPAFLLHHGLRPGDVLLIPHQGKARSFVAAPKELVWEAK